MMSEKENIELITDTKKEKNPKRVLAGKKAAEARKVKNEQKRKEIEKIEKENMKLKLSVSTANSEKKRSTRSITKDDSDDDDSHDSYVGKINVYKNYFPLCLVGLIGIGVFVYTSKQKQTPVYTSPTSPRVKPTVSKTEEIDPFEFN